MLLPSDLSMIDAAVSHGWRLVPPRRDETMSPWPLTILCGGVTANGADQALLVDELAAALTARGLAAAIAADAGLESLRSSLSALHRQRDFASKPMGVIGIGFGAPSACRLAADLPKVARLCLISPPDPDLIANGRFGELLSSEDREAITALQPLQGIQSLHDRTPLLMLHGAADHVVEPEQSLAYVQAASASSRQNVDHLLVAMGDHNFSHPAARLAMIERVVEFMHPLIEARDPAET
jgi:fermentation-respiration switch protein FrsA (DUF1100 family)